MEPQPKDGKGLRSCLSKKACLVLTEEFPAFSYPKMVSAVSKRLQVFMEQVDSNAILPLRAAPQAFYFAPFFQAVPSGVFAALPQGSTQG